MRLSINQDTLTTLLVLCQKWADLKSFQNAIDYSNKHKDTLVVATADRSTGGLSIAKGKDYVWNPEAIHKMKHSGSYMTKQIADGKDPEKVINDGYGFEFLLNKWIKLKTAAKELKEAQDKAKSEDDEKVAAATTKLQDAIQNQSTMNLTLVGLLMVIQVKT